MKIILRYITLIFLPILAYIYLNIISALDNANNELAKLKSIDDPIVIKKEEPKADELINLLPDETKDFISKIANIKNISASFTQIEQNIENKIIDSEQNQKIIKGNLKLAKPNRLYWNIKSPSTEKQIYITDGEKFWHYDVNLEQVVLDKFDSRRISNSPFYFLFTEPENLVDKFNIKKIGDKLFSLTSKKEADFDSNYISNLELKFNKDSEDLEYISFIAAKNKKITVSLDDVKVNSRLDKSEFNFNVPKGIDIIKANEIY